MISVFEKYLSHVKYKDWAFDVHMDGTRHYLQVSFMARDCFADENAPKVEQKGRKWLLSPHMTKSEVIQTAFKAVLTAEEHEVRENFLYKSKNVFGPHFNVDTLADMCGRDTQDIRPEMKAEYVTA